MVVFGQWLVLLLTLVPEERTALAVEVRLTSD
jgi:hypothetical protein